MFEEAASLTRVCVCVLSLTSVLEGHVELEIRRCAGTFEYDASEGRVMEY